MIGDHSVRVPACAVPVPLAAGQPAGQPWVAAAACCWSMAASARSRPVHSLPLPPLQNGIGGAAWGGEILVECVLWG